MAPNAEEEVREASWRRNQAGLGLEQRSYTLARGRRGHSMYWEAHRARQSQRKPRGTRRAHERWGGEVGRGRAEKGSCSAIWISLWNEEEQWRSLCSFWQNVRIVFQRRKQRGHEEAVPVNEKRVYERLTRDKWGRHSRKQAASPLRARVTRADHTTSALQVPRLWNGGKSSPCFAGTRSEK